MAGVLAVVAAWIPVFGVVIQTREISRIAAQERMGRATRARALLSQPLSDVYDYVKNSIKVTETLHGSGDDDVAVPRQKEEPLPPLPLEAIAAIGRTIEHAEARPARALAVLLEKMQVQRARLMSAMDAAYGRSQESIVLAVHVDDYLIDSIELLARCNGVFGFARLTSDEVDEPDAEDMAGAAYEARIFEEDRPGVYDLIRRRWGHFRPPTSFMLN